MILMRESILNRCHLIVLISIAVGSVERSVAPVSIRRNMPEPLPVMLLGRLTVDRAFQKIGIGRAPVRDAMLLTFKASEIA